MINWKTEGTKLYQALPSQLYATLKACDPLRAIPPDRPKMQVNYKPWTQTKS
jgi:phenylacetic acid degradation protein